MTSSELVELKPCPLCGGKAEYTWNQLYSDNTIATCRSCGCNAYYRKWNTRSDQPLLSATHYAEWQPIETAPKDGTRVILTDGRSVEVGCFAPNVHGDEHPWAFVDDYSGVDTTTGYVGVPANAWKVGAVTLWMPLPGTPHTSEDV